MGFTGAKLKIAAGCSRRHGYTPYAAQSQRLVGRKRPARPGILGKFAATRAHPCRSGNAAQSGAHSPTILFVVPAARSHQYSGKIHGCGSAEFRGNPNSRKLPLQLATHLPAARVYPCSRAFRLALSPLTGVFPRCLAAASRKGIYQLGGAGGNAIPPCNNSPHLPDKLKFITPS